MKVERIGYDPEKVLERAIGLWLREDRPMPSRIDSDVDLATNEVHLRNCNGLLATYRILDSGYLRRKAVKA
jgi:hypothetical protein